MNLKIFIGSFILVFLAELGDKTQLTALAFSASSRSPWSVFLGTSLALVAASGIAVLLGGFLARVIPEKTLLITSAVLFIVIGVILLVNVARKAPATKSLSAAAETTVLQPQPNFIFQLVLRQAKAFEEDTVRYFSDLTKSLPEGQTRTLIKTIAEEDRKHIFALDQLAEKAEMQPPGTGLENRLSLEESHPLLMHAMRPPVLTTAPVQTAKDTIDSAAERAEFTPLDYAVKAEEEAAEFYLALARLCRLPAARNALQMLAMEEIRHAQILCSLFNPPEGTSTKT